jgi:PEP-CTERM motif
VQTHNRLSLLNFSTRFSRLGFWQQVSNLVQGRMLMRKILLISSVVIVFLAFNVGAQASSYLLTISGTDTGSVTVTGTGPGGDPGSVLLTSGSGTINGISVSLVPAPAGTSFTHQYLDPISTIVFDDELFPSLTPPIDAAGLEFTDGAGMFFTPFADPVFGFGVLVLDPTTHFFSDSSGDHFAASLITTATPEPSSLLLLGTGILGLAGAARRKFMVNA